MNNCSKVTAIDGNYLNQFCKEKLKCMETIENNLYLTKMLGEMITEIYNSAYNKLGISGSVILSISFITFLIIAKSISFL